MKPIVRPTLLAAMLAGAAAAPAQADTTADLQTKIDAAMTHAKSFVVTTLYPAQAYSSTLVYVAPDRSRVAVAIAANTTDVVTVGNTSYSSKNGAPFEKADVSAEAGQRLKSIGSTKVTALHADVALGGTRYGAFETTLPLGADVTLTCTYDKKSFRLARCANDDVTETYSNYDDPKNVVEIPSNIAATPKDTK